MGAPTRSTREHGQADNSLSALFAKRWEALADGSYKARSLRVGTFVGIFLAAGLGLWAAVRILSVYVSERPSGYFNPLYAQGNNIVSVQAHAMTGMITACVLMPIAVLSHFNGAGHVTQLVSFYLFLGGSAATFATVIPLSSFTKIGDIAGQGVVVIAGLWAVAWAVACFVVGLAPCICRSKPVFRARWLVRASTLCAFGFLLLPIFYHCVGIPALNVVLNAILFVVMVVFAEGICWLVLYGENESSLLGGATKDNVGGNEFEL